MTTLSTHPRLSRSLAQTKGRCSDLSHSHALEHEIGATRTSDNGDGGDHHVGACNDRGDLVFEDEEIASVEADGTSGLDVPDDVGTVEEQFLTAALVTSIVELAAGTPCGVSRKSIGDTSGTEDVSPETRRISLMKSQAPDSTMKMKGNAYQNSFPHVNVTPPASASSSFSSVESIPEPLKKPSDVNQSYTVGRTIYERASKSAASQKVEFGLAPSIKTNTSLKVSHPRMKERKLNSNDAGIVKFSNLLELAVETSPRVNPVSKPALPVSMSWSSTATAGGTPGHQPIHCDESTCSTFSARDNEVSTDLMHQPEENYFKSLKEKTVQGRPNPNPFSKIKLGSEVNPSLVPNPLAGIQDSSINLRPLIFPARKPNSKGFTIKTNTLMSAAPDALVPGSNPPSRNVSTVHLGGHVANIAESMSPPHDQTDWLASEVVPPGRGRIFSIDLDPAVLDFVENVVDPLANTNESPGSCYDTCGAKNPNVTFRSGFDNNPGRTQFRRDRGFSFEFFSFGINEDEPLPPAPATMCGTHISQENRQRGDSIIFDPTSFREGGIHETSALLHIKQENDGQNMEVIPCVPLSHNAVSCTARHNLTQGASPTASTLHPLLSMGCAPTDAKTTSEACVSHVHGKPSFHPKLCSKVKFVSASAYTELAQPGLPSLPGVAATASSRTIPQAFSDNTIHMPHGSDAAAAAAAGMPQISPTTPHDGFSLSHTACPMELLNKGGRIGIYLPEERKSRIAKFHLKRKIRIWRKRIKYDCRKKLADSRPRIKGRFVKRSEVDGEALL